MDDDELIGSKWDQVKRAASLAMKHRKRVKDGDFSVFLMPLSFAISKDFLFDVINAIPVIGFFLGGMLGLPITVYLFIFMWGRGKWKLRIIFFLISLFDIIPGVGLIPFTTASVIYGYHLARKDADEAKDKIEKIKKAYPELSAI